LSFCRARWTERPITENNWSASSGFGPRILISRND